MKNIIKKPFLLIIRFYQASFSPDHGIVSKIMPVRCCKFRPTCSEYTYQAINKYGVIKGFYLGFWRIVRCNPWSKGGWDPIK